MPMHTIVITFNASTDDTAEITGDLISYLHEGDVEDYTMHVDGKDAIAGEVTA